MKPNSLKRIRVIDSHTAGEPTRVVVDGVDEPAGATMAEKRESFARDFDWLRTASICEPRGYSAIVGAMLCEPVADDCVAGVIFFNNAGVLNGCLHGTMGLAVTLQHLGKISPGTHRIDTPTGVVSATVSEGGAVTVKNVRSYRTQSGISIEVPGFGAVKGDVAWGGNWFFLTTPPTGLQIDRARIRELTDFSSAVKRALAESGITGSDGGEIDHIEVFGSPTNPASADSKNFVLCPGNEYDRSPCGTGTSAKLACLFADGLLRPGEMWRQAGILDSVFEGSVEPAPNNEDGIVPTVTGHAYITAETELIIDPATPFAFGIPSTIL